ncbi:MAG: lysophospholipid acyltransferase family protein, partial [Thermodesulfobacteriota bacterium]
MDLKDKILYCGVSGGVRLLGLIPFSWHEPLGRILGRTWYRMDKRHRNLAVNNIRYAYGDSVTEDRAEKLAGKVFENFARMVFEHAWFNRLPRREYHRYFRVKGLHHLHKAHAKGRGVIGISAHMGNWELGLAMYHLFGVPFCVVYKPIKN